MFGITLRFFLLDKALSLDWNWSKTPLDLPVINHNSNCLTFRLMIVKILNKAGCLIPKGEILYGKGINNMEAINWKPDHILTNILTKFANDHGKSPEVIITEAVRKYLNIQNTEHPHTKCDPLIGLFSGPEDLSKKSEDILHENIKNKSGWTWKEKS